MPRPEYVWTPETKARAVKMRTASPPAPVKVIARALEMDPRQVANKLLRMGVTMRGNTSSERTAQ